MTGIAAYGTFLYVQRRRIMLSPRCPSYLGVNGHMTFFPFRSVTLEGFRRNLTQMFTRRRRCAEAMFWMASHLKPGM